MSNPYGKIDKEKPPKLPTLDSEKLARELGTKFRPIRRVKKAKPSRFWKGDENTKFMIPSREPETAVRKAYPKSSPSAQFSSSAKREVLLENLANLYDVPDEVRSTFISRLRKHTDAIRDFLVTEIAPFEVAIEAASEEAKEALEIITETKDAQVDFSQPRKIASKMAELRTIEFLCEIFGASSKIRALVFQTFMDERAHAEKLSALQALLRVSRSPQISPARVPKLRREESKAGKVRKALVSED